MSNDYWDADIAELDMSPEEKNGLQLYRTYTKKFTEYREHQFAAAVDREHLDTSELSAVTSLLSTEDIRFVPVVACAFADEQLKLMFKTFLRDELPGGKKAMIGRFGPISSLFSRIQFAHAFDMISADILIPLDKLREQRNKLSHTWNSSLLAEFFNDPLPQMEGLESALSGSRVRVSVDHDSNPQAALRIRSMWILTRIFYESRFYPMAKERGLKPASALYGERHPKCLGKICLIPLNASRQVASQT